MDEGSGRGSPGWRNGGRRGRDPKLFLPVVSLALLAMALVVVASTSNDWYVAEVHETQLTDDDVEETVHLGLRTGEIHFRFPGGDAERVMGFHYSDNEDTAGNDFTNACGTTYLILIGGALALGAFLVLVVVTVLGGSRGERRALQLAPFIIGLVATVVLAASASHFGSFGLSALEDDNWDYFDWDRSGLGMAFWMVVGAVLSVALASILTFILVRSAAPGPDR